MMRKLILPLTACLLVGGLQAPLWAADPVEEQMSLLYQKLHFILGGSKLNMQDPKEATAEPLRTLLILANPGIPLSQDFDPAHSDSDADLLNEMADQIPKANEFYVPNSGWTYSSLYEKIIANKQTKDIKLTAQQEKDLAEAEEKIKPGSDLRTQFDAANDAFQNALADKVNAEALAQTLDEFRKDLVKAKGEPEKIKDAGKEYAEANGKKSKASSAYLTAYNSLQGVKNKINGYFQTIQEITAFNGKAWWQSVADKFHAAKHNDFYSVTFFPPASGWNAATNDWTHFEFKNGDKTTSESSTTTSIQAAASLKRGAISASGGMAKDDFNADKAMQSKDFSVAFEIKRVNVFRRWWDPDVFANKHWWLPESVGNGELSWGTLEENRKKDAPMPVYVTSIFLIRNMVVSSSWLKEHENEFKHAIEAHGKVDVGPVSASFGYSRKDTGKNAQSSYSNGAITSPGIQIIGYLGSVLPRTPIHPPEKSTQK